MGKKVRRPRNFKHLQKQQQQEQEENKTKDGSAPTSKRQKTETSTEEDEGEEKDVQDLDYDNAMAAGLAFLQLDANEAAVEAFEVALKQQPESVDALTQLGDLYAQVQQLDKAVDMYHRATTTVKDDASLWFRLAGAYEANEKFEDAIGAYKQSERLSRLEFEAAVDEEKETTKKAWGMSLAALANCFGMKEDLDGAAQVYRNALKIDGSNANLHFNLATMLVAHEKITTKQETEAIKAYEQAIVLAAMSSSTSVRDFYDDFIALLEKNKKKHAKKLQQARKAVAALPPQTQEADEAQDAQDTQ